MAKRPSPSSSRVARSASPKKAVKKAAARPAPKKVASKAPVAKKPVTKKSVDVKVAKSAKVVKPGVKSQPVADGLVQESSTLGAPVTEAQPAAKTPGVKSGKRSTPLAIDLARSCADDKCEDVVLLDVSSIRQDMDYVLIASGTSDRQMRSVLRHLEELGASMGHACLRTSSDERATWLLADFVDIMVHLFEPHTRTHYDLEMLWGDAPRVAWQRPDQMVRDRAQLRASAATGI